MSRLTDIFIYCALLYMKQLLLSFHVSLLTILLSASVKSFPTKWLPLRGNSVLRQYSAHGEPIFGGLHHCGVIVKNTEISKNFYLNVFGFTDVTHLRPNTLPYPGAFIQCGVSQIHLMELPNPDEASIRPAYGGRDRHIAISVNSIELLSKRLASHGLEFKVSSSGRSALFCRDPDGNAYEFVEDSIPS